MSKKFKTTEEKSASGYNDPFFEILKSERLLTKKELAEFLNVSIKMIDRKVSMNEIPYMKIGKLVRFDKRSILTWARAS